MDPMSSSLAPLPGSNDSSPTPQPEHRTVITVGHLNPIQDDARSKFGGPALSTEVPDGRPVSTVSSACLACRDKHLKCDGLVPCSRCISSLFQCVYVPSRRGIRGPRTRRPRSPSSAELPDLGRMRCPMYLGAPVVSVASPSEPVFPSFPSAAGYGDTSATGRSSSSPSVAQTPTPDAMQVYQTPFSSGHEASVFALNTSTLGHLQQQPHPVASLEDRCFDAFYHYFHAAHPFILPKNHFLQLLKDGNTNLEHLVTAMKYIGSLFIDAGPCGATLLEQAIRLSYLPTTLKDGFLVQALLLLVVGLDGNSQQAKARELLAYCERIALDISLNTRPFAALHGRENPVLEESWRRTWWDLYVCDGMVAGVHMITNFALFDIDANVGLPCEELQYLTGRIPPTMYMEDFEDQLFLGEDTEFSSFTYRIAAIKILGSMMRMPTSLFPNDESIAQVQALLTNWKIHLPESKRYNIGRDCRLDEMMFQAHFIVNACLLNLHQPLSQLDTSPVQAVTSCAPYRPVPSGDVFNIHTRHAVTAASEISKMITWPGSLLGHTHFFTCVITLSSIVHLSKWALYMMDDEQDLRQQIRLNIGALNQLSKVWKAAKTAAGQVKGTAQEIFQQKKRHQMTPTFWVGFTQEQMISSINADQGIIGEINEILSNVTQP